MKEYNTYSDIIKKSSVGSISAEQYQTIISGPLCYKTPVGLTKIASEIITQQCAILTEHSSKIWLQIEKIKAYVEKRNQINEKCMNTEQEINYLLKTTEQLQAIIEHINTQEHTFMELTHNVNHNIYNIFIKYIEKNEKLHTTIQDICAEVATELDSDALKQATDHEGEIANCISIEHIKYFIYSNNIDAKHNIDSYSYADYYLDTNQYEDFVMMQTWVTLLYRLSAHQVLDNQEQAYDHRALIKAVLKHKDKAKALIDTEHMEVDFGLDDYNKTLQMSHDLTAKLKINSEYEKKMNASLDKLIVISSSRKPKEYDDEE